MNSPKSLILRVGVVIFAVSLLAGYVVFSQTRARPQIPAKTEPSSTTVSVNSAPMTEGGSLVEGEVELMPLIVSEPPHPSLEGIAAFGTKSGVPLIDARSLRLEIAKPIPASTQQSRSQFAPGSKTMIHVVPPSTFDSLLQRKPEPLNSPGSDTSPILPQGFEAQTGPAPRTMAPGSKSMVPLIRVPPPANSPAQQQRSR
jgi:hypothetical protein